MKANTCFFEVFKNLYRFLNFCLTCFTVVVLCCIWYRLLLPIVDHSSVHASNPRWLAPEVLKDNIYGFKADVYSFGIILWELLTWQQPWEECGLRSCHTVTIYNWVREGQRPVIPSQDELPAGPCPVYSDLVKLITQCWDQKPCNRPMFSGIVKRLDELLRAVVKTEVSTHTNSQSHAFSTPSDDPPVLTAPARLNGVSREKNQSTETPRKVPESPVNLSPRRSPPPMSPFLDTRSSSQQPSPRSEMPDLPSPFKQVAGMPWSPSSESQGIRGPDPSANSSASQESRQDAAVGKHSSGLPGNASGNPANLSPRRSPPPISPFLATRSSSAKGSSRAATPDSPSPFKKVAMTGTPWPPSEKRDPPASDSGGSTLSPRETRLGSAARSGEQTPKDANETPAGCEPCDKNTMFPSPFKIDGPLGPMEVRGFSTVVFG